ncbi:MULTISPECIES: FAD-dependent oxidoreductase [unclassified Sedimentibacter]|uniref:FAD-dependent oxidoreductase n=1 Tax=unclassified Sedimentibacter TaxID=2649220 RepID=UPI0027DFFCA2|nr:FAD-dependent oxidoreductase [Sedimentibacter sp. MB35-C1]WMJ78900.1 FAD-dependent oxidoreductase [Sedimentibacter sp. MB35-C1]
MRIIIVGAVAAGTSAATEIRRNDKNAEIVIYERDKYISYAGCGMPYYISNEFTDLSSLIPRNSEFFKKKSNIDVMTEHEVVSIDPNSKSVTVKNILMNETFTDIYDKLIIATGARIDVPDIKGIERNNVFFLRNIENMNLIKSFIESEIPKKAAIIGSGFIGMEMCESFKKLGMEVTLIARSTISKGMDGDMTSYIENYLTQKKVTVITNAPTKEINEKGVVLNDGKIVEADIILVAAGIKPNVELAAGAGVEIGVTGAIKTDKHMRTNIADIYSCGDCAESYNTITGKAMYRPLGSTANKTGTIAGSSICGKADEFRGILGTGIYRIFDMTVGQTGLSEAEAKMNGYDAVSIIDQKYNKPEYLGGKPIIIKAVADRKTGIVLGAQIVGFEGVDKRLDVFVTAISLKAKAEDLMHLDLAYSPPYSIPRDPVYYSGAKLRAALDGNRKK